MGDTENSNGRLSVHKSGQERRPEINSFDITRAGETEMAYSISTGQQEQRDYGFSVKPENCRTCHAGTEIISNAYQQLLEIGESQPGNNGQECKTAPRVYDQWPAGPGQQQYEWEEPRTASTIIRLPGSIRKIWNHSGKGFKKMLGEEAWEKINAESKTPVISGLGLSVDGYNFREDLLRAIGNSVVEQTAEVAFIHLLKKHLKSIGQ